MLNFMGMRGDSFAANDYICLDGHIYVWSLQNQSKLCFCSQLFVYLQIVKNENLLIWKIMK